MLLLDIGLQVLGDRGDTEDMGAGGLHPAVPRRPLLRWYHGLRSHWHQGSDWLRNEPTRAHTFG